MKHSQIVTVTLPAHFSVIFSKLHYSEPINVFELPDTPTAKKKMGDLYRETIDDSKKVVDLDFGKLFHKESTTPMTPEFTTNKVTIPKASPAAEAEIKSWTVGPVEDVKLSDDEELVSRMGFAPGITFDRESVIASLGSVKLTNNQDGGAPICKIDERIPLGGYKANEVAVLSSSPTHGNESKRSTGTIGHVGPGMRGLRGVMLAGAIAQIAQLEAETVDLDEEGKPKKPHARTIEPWELGFASEEGRRKPYGVIKHISTESKEIQDHNAAIEERKRLKKLRKNK